MGVLGRLFGRAAIGHGTQVLYRGVVDEARRPHWYAQGGVPDTLDGRFDMVAAVASLVLLRLETLGDPAREPAAGLAELFVADMDGQLREQGIGDVVVGKHIGRMMGALGGRVGALREGLAPGGDLSGTVARNLHRGAEVPAEARGHAEREVRALHDRLTRTGLDALLAGRLA